ncbi:MAG: LytR/AlgR family response regulator transcription factor [Acutalibacteraceae bacterium]
MISEYESYAVEAMLGFYNNDFDKFLEFLDENVIWYGPKQGQYVVGKENLMNTVCIKQEDRVYRVENVQTKLISYTANLYSIVVTYQLHSYRSDGTVKTVFQHVVANGQKIRDRNGNVFWRCPFIHVSNAEQKTKGGKSDFSSFSFDPKKLFLNHDVPRLVLPGDNHTTVYIRQDSIKYIVGGKGVMCYVYTDDGVYLVRQLLKQILEQLPDFYYRCHSSYIVNLRYVLYLSSSKITLTDSSEIPISSKRYAQIKSDIEKWMNTQKTDDDS